jgi:hypothetical protein
MDPTHCPKRLPPKNINNILVLDQKTHQLPTRSKFQCIETPNKFKNIPKIQTIVSALRYKNQKMQRCGKNKCICKNMV